MAELESTRKVVKLFGRSLTHYVTFGQLRDDHRETLVTMPVRDWVEMGSPSELTLTIEPGDLLNA